MSSIRQRPPIKPLPRIKVTNLWEYPKRHMDYSENLVRFTGERYEAGDIVTFFLHKDHPTVQLIRDNPCGYVDLILKIKGTQECKEV